MPKMKYCAIIVLLSAVCPAAEIRLGIIGTDTSHVVAFTKILNDPASPDYLPGARIVAAIRAAARTWSPAPRAWRSSPWS